jgi:hypothetical protein
MLSKLVQWLSTRKERKLLQALHPQKRIKVEGILFTIRKINPIDYFAGYNSVQKLYDTYKRTDSGKVEFDESAAKKAKAHYRDVIMSGVVEPKLTAREQDQEPPYKGLHVEALFANWEICEKLYEEILKFTYGKKKLRSYSSLVNG